ncbi:uncharacterized protein LOC111878785 isoform X1 [Lactuca sativa]|uniref:uncharacterized protein LOC111878785 isoform X1 n=1 Tax=Lactuca sativa TaxID=4236 RepID=UPI000CD8A9AC|nr:uncharacterized protein LOC111878785 isoform X1 [Lactuca sativa]
MVLLQFLNVENQKPMEGRTPASGFSTIVDQASLFSVFGGIIMCKVAYDLTGVISPLVFKGFNKLESVQKFEWKNRGISTFHALFVAIASYYFLVVSNLFDEHDQQEFIVYRSSASSNTILAMSLGYFLSDLAMIIWMYPTLGGPEYVFHHGLSMFGIIQSLICGQAQFYNFIVLFSEITTPFVNIRWYLDVAGKKNSMFYLLNGVAVFVGWLAARVILFIFFFHHMFTHFDQVKQTYWTIFCSLLTIPSVLTIMNLFWFWKIAKGLIKTLTKFTRHSHGS